MCAKICELKYLRCVRQLPVCLFCVWFLDSFLFHSGCLLGHLIRDSFVVISIVHFKWYGQNCRFTHIIRFISIHSFVLFLLFFESGCRVKISFCPRYLSPDSNRTHNIHDKKKHTLTFKWNDRINVTRLRTGKMNKNKTFKIMNE